MTQSVKVVVLTGTGKGFCSGGRVDDIIGPLLKMKGDELYKFTRMTCNVVKNMRNLKKPIIAAVNGIAAGAGAMLMLASDLRIFSDKARAAFLFVKVGLSGADMGALYLLPRIVGLGKATELVYFGDTIDAQEAHRIGLANRVVAGRDFNGGSLQVGQSFERRAFVWRSASLKSCLNTRPT